MPKDSIYGTLTDYLSYQKVCAHFLHNIVTGDEKWCFQYDLKTKRQISKCKPKKEQATKRFRFGNQKWRKCSFVFKMQRGLFIISSFHRAQKLTRHFD